MTLYRLAELEGTVDVDGLARRLPQEAFIAWHTYFQYKDRQQTKQLLPILAMQYNTSLLIASAQGGVKLKPSDFKTAEDFLADGPKRAKAKDRISAEDSMARARERYGH